MKIPGDNSFGPTCRRKTEAGHVYDTEEAAAIQAGLIRQYRAADVRPFFCLVCGYYHIGKPPSENREPTKKLKKAARQRKKLLKSLERSRKKNSPRPKGRPRHPDE